MGDFLNFTWLCLQNAFSPAWNSVNIVSTIVELGVSAVIVRLPKHGDTALKYGARAVLWTFGIIFAGRLLLSPYFVFENLKKEHGAIPGPSPATINVNEADPLVRQELANTKRDLDDTKRKLAMTQESLREQNPLLQTIASATASATIEFLTSRRPAYNGAGALIGLGGGIHGNDECLMASTVVNTDLSSDPNKTKVRIECVCPPDDAFMGKPVKALLSCKFIQVILNPVIVSENTKVIGGQIILVINNRIPLKFNIPEQTTIKQPGGTSLSVPDLSTGLEPLMANP